MPISGSPARELSGLAQMCKRKKAGKAAKAKPKTPVKKTTQGCPLAPNSYGKAIKIEGDEAFRKKTIQALDDIKKTKTGKALLASLDKSGKTVTIKPTTDGNACGYDNPNDRFAKPDGKPGKGTNSTVYFNPDKKKIGSEKWEERPPAIGLGHELIHAEQAAYGTTAPGTTTNDKKPDPADPKKYAQVSKREAETVGIPPNDKRPYTENKLRSEWDPKQPERKWY